MGTCPHCIDMGGGLCEAHLRDYYEDGQNEMVKVLLAGWVLRSSHRHFRAVYWFEKRHLKDTPASESIVDAVRLAQAAIDGRTDD